MFPSLSSGLDAPHHGLYVPSLSSGPDALHHGRHGPEGQLRSFGFAGDAAFALCFLRCRQAQMLRIMAGMFLHCCQAQMLFIVAGMDQKDSYAVGWFCW